MAWLDELLKLQRVRRAWVRWAQELNPVGGWIGDLEQHLGKTADNTGDIPVIGHVVDFGTFKNAVANHEFTIEIPTIRTTLLDPLNQWRTRADRPSNQLLQRKLAYYLRQHTDDDEVLDELIAIGQIGSPTFPPGQVSLNVDITGGDLLGEDVGRRLLTTEDWPRALPEHLGRVIPFAYGHLSNAVLPVIIVEEEEEPTGEVEWNPCGCQDEDIQVGDLIWAWDIQSGDWDNTANWHPGPGPSPAHGWAYGMPGYPDPVALGVRFVSAVQVNSGDAPGGTNSISVLTSSPSRRWSFVKYTPFTTGTATIGGNPNAMTWTGWNAAANRYSFDLMFESSLVGQMIAEGWYGAGTGQYAQVFGFTNGNALFELECFFSPLISGIPTGLGPSGSNLTLRWGVLVTEQFTSGSFGSPTTTVPMDTWLHFEVDWKAGTRTSGSSAPNGCWRIAYTPDGGSEVELWRETCRRLILNQNQSLPAGYYADFALFPGPVLPQPDYQYMGEVYIGGQWPSGNVFKQANHKVFNITLEEPEVLSAPESSGPILAPIITEAPECADTDGVNDFGAAGRGGWLRALLVDTGGGNAALSDYGTPTAGAATIQPSSVAAPVLAGSAQSGGLGNTGGTFYYAAVSLQGGVMSDLSNVVSVTIAAGQKVHLTWTGVGDVVRVYRSLDPTFEAYDTYRVSGYPYAISDVPLENGTIDDLYPGYDTRGDPVTPDGGDPHWDVTYRQTKYYYISALYADGSESACSPAMSAGLFPRTAPLPVEVTWTAPAAGSVAVVGYRLRRASQNHHFEQGFDREWVFDASTTSYLDLNNDTSAVTACATPPTGEGTTGDQKPTYCLTGHTLKAVNEVFVLKPDPNSDTNEFVQVLMEEGTDYVQEVIERNGNRYHCLVFNEQQRSETCQYYDVSANVDGVESNADGSGELLENADDIVEHILLNIVFNTYRSSVGQYAPIGGKYYLDVEYSPGLFNRDSVAAAKAVAASRITGGYLGAGALVDKTPARQLIHDLLVSYDLDFYQYQGAWYIRRFGGVDRSLLQTIDPNTIGKDTFTSELLPDRQVNLIPFFAGPIGGGENEGYLISGEVKDDLSIELFRRIIISEPVYMLWTQDAATAFDVVRQYLRRLRFPPTNATFEAALQWLALPPGAEVLITHPDGPMTTGWVARACRILANDLDLDSLTCRITVRDVDDLIP